MPKYKYTSEYYQYKHLREKMKAALYHSLLKS